MHSKLIDREKVERALKDLAHHSFIVTQSKDFAAEVGSEALKRYGERSEMCKIDGGYKVQIVQGGQDG